MTEILADDAPFVITDPEGRVLAAFRTAQDRDDALHTGDYPDDAEPAFIN